MTQSISRAKRLLSDRSLQFLGPLALVAVWCVVTYGGLVDTSKLPSPTQLFEVAAGLITEGFHAVTLQEHIVASLTRALSGFVLAAIAGILVGLLMGYYRWADNLLTLTFSFFRPIPPIAFIPLVVIYFGIGQMSKIVLIFYAAFLYMVLSAHSGVRTVPDILIRAGKNVGMSSSQLFMRVLVPGAMPHIISGLRTSISIAWALIVAAELVAADRGLGYMIMEAGNFYNLPVVYVGIIAIGVIGVLLDGALLLLKKRVLHWEGR
ncbi:ABC transporter permease [Microbacterium soli]|uniref:ABC transporter permease n=1 Tax=Microbacterium soli TaxID=446075 RepID=A0ABP7NC95_9MICO